MATLDVSAIRRIPGRLAFGCTNLALAWPHGGTGLGAVRDVVAERVGAAYPVTIEALGGEPVEYLEPGEAWKLRFRVRTLDDDMMAKEFRTTAAGTVTQRRLVTFPSTAHAGEWMSAREFAVTFTPDGATHAVSATAPDSDAIFIHFYRILPVMGDPLAIALNGTEDIGTQCAWMALRHSSKGPLAIGRRRDISL